MHADHLGGVHEVQPHRSGASKVAQHGFYPVSVAHQGHLEAASRRRERGLHGNPGGFVSPHRVHGDAHAEKIAYAVANSQPPR